MRIPALVRHLPLLLAIFSPTLLLAQFQQPTQEELKMTADPMAPGAAAVYLEYDEVANDPLHYQTVYARIKILTEKGKSLATVSIPYDRSDYKVTDIQARTIHSDGTIIPLVGKPEDLLIAKTTSKYGDQQFNRKVFTLPSVEVGSILEYRYTVSYDDDTVSSPIWEIQKPYFIHKSHYSFTPFKAFLPGALNVTASYVIDERGRHLNNLIWWPLLPSYIHEFKPNAAGIYELNLTDIPPAPDEDWMPPGDTYLYRVKFYYTYEPNNVRFWAGEVKLWSKDVNHFAEPSKSIRAAVDGLIAPGDSDLDKAKKLYVAVQALDNTDYSRQKTASEMKELKIKEIMHAGDVWTEKSGNSNEIALLYLAMLRVAGLTAYDMRIVDRQTGVFDPAYLSLNQFQDDLILLVLNGKEILLDPGEKMCPFQTVGWEHSGAGGIRQSPDVHFAAMSPLQTFSDNKTERIGDLTIDAHGAVTGSIRIIMTGQDALYWREWVLENNPDELKKQFDSGLADLVPAGVEAHVDHFLGLDDPYANLMAIVNVHGSLGTATSRRLLLPGFFFATKAEHPFVKEDKRLVDVDMHYAKMETNQITYHLPSGFSVEGAPLDTKIPWAGHAVFVAKTAATPGQITIVRILARAFTFAKPAEYQDLRGFYQKIASADQGELVLLKTPAAKGN